MDLGTLVSDKLAVPYIDGDQDKEANPRKRKGSFQVNEYLIWYISSINNLDLLQL